MTITDERLTASKPLDQHLRDVSHAAYMEGQYVLAERLEEAADSIGDATAEYQDDEWTALELAEEAERLRKVLDCAMRTIDAHEAKMHEARNALERLERCIPDDDDDMLTLADGIRETLTDLEEIAGDTWNTLENETS